MTTIVGEKRKYGVSTLLEAAALDTQPLDQTPKKAHLLESSESLDADSIASNSSELVDSPEAASVDDDGPAIVQAWGPRLLQARHVEQLNTLGYAVVEGVVDAGACATRHARLLDEMAIRGVNWKDPTVRRSTGPQVHGIVQHLEIGHAAAVWETRQEEKVARVFEELYGDNDLLVSFDGICLWRANDTDDCRSWWHVDQNHKRRGLRCIQGSVVIAPCAGGLAVLPQSHKFHEAFGNGSNRAGTGNDDWFKFTPQEFDQLKAMSGTSPLVVTAPVGSLVLWDSRLAHMARMPPADAPIAQRSRCVVYVCYQPRALINAANLAKKRKAFDEYRMTTHWPASNVKLFPNAWRTWGAAQVAHNPTPEQRTRVETPRMFELAGKTLLTTRTRRVSTPALKFVKE